MTINANSYDPSLTRLLVIFRITSFLHTKSQASFITHCASSFLSFVPDFAVFLRLFQVSRCRVTKLTQHMFKYLPSSSLLRNPPQSSADHLLIYGRMSFA